MAITFRDFFSQGAISGTILTTSDIIGALLVSLVLALFVFYIYKKTYTGILYSRNFNLTLILVAMITTVIMLGISGNIALALGMVGALSIVRFRAAIKDPKDIAFLFWAITIGIVNGAQFYKLTLIGSAFIGVIAYIFSRKITIDHPYILILKYDDNVNETRIYDVIKRYCSKYNIRNKTLVDTKHELTIEVKLRKKHYVNILLKELKKFRGVEKAMMFSYTGDLSE